jgi:hypothetical protein
MHRNSYKYPLLSVLIGDHMDAAATQPLISLPPAFESGEDSALDNHLENLFSENDLKRAPAKKWLSDHLNPEIIVRISEKAVKRCPLPENVRADVRKLLSLIDGDLLQGVGNLKNEKRSQVQMAITQTFRRSRMRRIR